MLKTTRKDISSHRQVKNAIHKKRFENMGIIVYKKCLFTALCLLQYKHFKMLFEEIPSIDCNAFKFF